jgi:hypothetical protein
MEVSESIEPETAAAVVEVENKVVTKLTMASRTEIKNFK